MIYLGWLHNKIPLYNYKLTYSFHYNKRLESNKATIFCTYVFVGLLASIISKQMYELIM